jgi:hypothetical protein
VHPRAENMSKAASSARVENDFITRLSSINQGEVRTGLVHGHHVRTIPFTARVFPNSQDFFGNEGSRPPAADFGPSPPRRVCVSKVGGIVRSTGFQSVPAQDNPHKRTHGLKSPCYRQMRCTHRRARSSPALPAYVLWLVDRVPRLAGRRRVRCADARAGRIMWTASNGKRLRMVRQDA